MRELRFTFKLMAVAVAVMAVGLLGKGSLTDTEAHSFVKNYSVQLSAVGGGALSAGTPVNTTSVLNIPTLGDPFFTTAVTNFSGIDSTPAAVPLGHEVGSGSFSIDTNGGAILSSGQPAPCGGNPVGQPYEIYSALTANQAHASPGPAGSWNVGFLGNFGTLFFDPTPGTGDPWVEDWGIPATGSPLPQSTKADPDFGNLPMAVRRAPVYLPILDQNVSPLGHATRGFGVAVVFPGVAHTGVDFVTYENVPGPGFNAVIAVVGQGGALGIYPSIPSGGQALVTCPPFSSSTTTFGESVPAGPNAVDPAATVQEIQGAGAQVYRISLASASDYTGDGIADFQDLCKAHVGSTDAGNGIGTECNTEAAWQQYEELPWVGSMALPPAGYPSPLDDAGANAALLCTGLDTSGDPWGGTITNPQTAVIGGPPWAPCQDADGDGWLNSQDNCPLHNDQLATNNAGDSVGNICDPSAQLGPGAEFIKGDGRGWGFPQSAVNPGLATLHDEGYHHHSDICTRDWNVGAASDGSPQPGGCLTTVLDALNVPYFDEHARAITTSPDNIRDSARNGSPDWLPNPGALNACDPSTWLSAARTDSDGDGKADWFESRQAWLFGTGGVVANPCSLDGSFGLDALSPIDGTGYPGARLDDAEPNRNPWYSCKVTSGSTRALQRSDVGRTGTVVLGDITTVLGQFGNSAGLSLTAARANVLCGGTVVLGDATTTISNFGATVLP